ncbi:YcxB family protein [Ahniella affigens]|uniref:YcxB family protein n=1 Tax=Ahniella affigens TaxID=2021234 RepID=UPI0011B25039|nr:YcxB family protein [Ahniella affigens]
MAASLAGLRARPVIAAIGALFFIALPWIAAIVSCIALAQGKAVSVLTIAIFVAVPPLFTAGMLLMPFVLFGRSPALLGPHRYEFSDEQMTFVGPAFDNKLQWQIVDCYVSSRLGIYLFAGKLPLVSIPKRAVDPAVTEALHELFARKGLRQI